MRQLYEYHPVIGYRFIPNLRARIPHESGGYLLQANASGFRSERPFTAAANVGQRRVLLFGDSFTAGDGVANRQRYSDLLETMVPALEVYNYGLSSSGTDQQYLAWREYARDVAHDVVVIAVFVENVRRIMARYRPHRDASGRERLYAKPYFALEHGGLCLRQVPPPPEGREPAELDSDARSAVDTGGRFPRLRSLVTALGARDAVQRITRYQPLPEYDHAETPGWRLMHAILAQWVGALRRPVVVMPLPLPQHMDKVCDAAPYQARFAELARATGCILHDPLPQLLALGEVERRALRWPVDIHYTPAGHAAIAQSLAPVLARVLGPVRAKEGVTPCPN